MTRCNRAPPEKLDASARALVDVLAAQTTADDLLELLYTLIPRHGKPDHIRSENRPEFTSEAFQIGFSAAA